MIKLHSTTGAGVHVSNFAGMYPEAHIPMYFVEDLLAKDFYSLRQQALGRYVGFYQSLVNSPCKEVAVVSRIVGQDATTTTGNNLLSLRLETRLDVKLGQVVKTKKVLDVKTAVPEVDSLRLPLLSKYLKTM